MGDQNNVVNSGREIGNVGIVSVGEEMKKRRHDKGIQMRHEEL